MRGEGLDTISPFTAPLHAVPGGGGGGGGATNFPLCQRMRMGEMGEGGTERRLIDTGTGKREVRGGREGITRLSRREKSA